MDYYYLLIPLLLSIVIIILYSQNKKKKEIVEKLVFEKHELETLRKDEIKDYFKEEWSREENELDNRLRLKREAIKSESTKLESDFQISKTELDGLLRQMEVLLKEKEKRYNEVNQDLDLYKQGKMKEIDGTAAEYEQRKHNLIDQSIEKYRNKQMTLANAKLELMQAERDDYLKEIEEIKTDLEAERSKRAAINEEIRREQLLAKEKDAHRIILSDEDKEDIVFLTTILPKINHKETLYKLIWSEYLIKPYQNMIKQLFGSKVPKNVIYCIESIDGKYKYIGKTSADVSKRWSEHIKTSLNIGGVSRSKVHDALYLHWDEFTFSILEETTKECLSEREKYYINFFESDKYGLNIKSGG